MSLSLFLPLSPAARAGSYTVSYSGDPSYSIAGGAYGKVIGGTQSTPYSQTLNSTITATLTWTPDPNIPGDAPPPAIQVAQDSRAGWYNDNDADGGTLLTGLTGTVITSGGGIGANRSGEGGITHFLEQTKTTVISNPGQTQTFTCTPSASTSVKPPRNYGSLVVCVDYKVTATPVTVSINLQGTTVTSGQHNILVGQGCTAKLVSTPNVLSFSGYHWSVGGNTFQSWNGDSGTVPVAAVFGYGDPTLAQPHWYWNDTAGSKTITCTATAQPPSGQGSSFTVTATKQVNLQRPTWAVTNTGGLGYIIHGTIYALQAGPTPLMLNQGYSEGSNWRTTVSIPAPFSSAGQFGYAQIITPGEYLTPYGGTEQGSPDNGQTGLDRQFPYIGDIYNSDGIRHDDGDSPSIPLNTAQTSPDVISYVRLTDSFNTYLMFKPPLAPTAPNSYDVQWVPLAESDWHLNMGAGRPLSRHWSDFPTTQSCGGVYVDSDFVIQTTHPAWTLVSSQLK